MADVAALPTNGATLSVFTNEKGGIIDDTVIVRGIGSRPHGRADCTGPRAPLLGSRAQFLARCARTGPR